MTSLSSQWSLLGGLLGKLLLNQFSATKTNEESLSMTTAAKRSLLRGLQRGSTDYKDKAFHICDLIGCPQKQTKDQSYAVQFDLFVTKALHPCSDRKVPEVQLQLQKDFEPIVHQLRLFEIIRAINNFSHVHSLFWPKLSISFLQVFLLRNSLFFLIFFIW